MIFVIGSGPAGVAAASALLARGQKVTMLDVGFKLEDEIQSKLAKFKESGNIDQLKEFKYPLIQKDIVKLAYGSDYVYRNDKLIDFIADDQVYCKPSFAQGGLSNTWGAFVDSYHPNDFNDWPFLFEKLSPYYEKVFEFLPRATSQIQEDQKYNSYTSSEQAKYLLAEYLSSAGRLSACGFQFGSAKLAVTFSNQNQKCIYCGMCQYGCPNSLIYSANDTLRVLLKNKNFVYKSGIFIEKIEENDTEIILHGLKYLDEEKTLFNASQVFIACGAILSTVLILNSSEVNKSAILKDSQHFMFPCVLFKKFKNIHQENLHTLCQIFLKFKNDDLLLKEAHLQIYTYMDQYVEEFQRRTGRLFPLIRWLISPLLSRLIVIQGFLHSEDSKGILLQVEKPTSKTNNLQVKMTVVENKSTELKIKKILSHLRKKSYLLKLFPLGFILKISKVGQSYHYGGSFPMSEDTVGNYTDLMGRVSGFTRAHLVDGTIFPTIPANSITTTIMANSYRIATECDIYG